MTPVPAESATSPPRPRLADRATRPLLTASAVAAATIAAVVQYTVPDAVPTLQRDGAALRAGQSWRLVSPLAVQTLGWYQVAVNLVTLAAVGAVTERLLGRRWWLLLAITGTAAGQVAAYARGEPGGGDSIAICGLAGGAVAAMAVRRGRPPSWGVRPVAVYIAALSGWDVFGPLGAAALVTVAGAGFYGPALVHWVSVPWIDRAALLACVGCAAVLSLIHDLHGICLAAGMVVTAALLSLGAVVRRTRPFGA